jgi:hypothetical protein
MSLHGSSFLRRNFTVVTEHCTHVLVLCIQYAHTRTHTYTHRHINWTVVRWFGCSYTWLISPGVHTKFILRMDNNGYVNVHSSLAKKKDSKYDVLFVFGATAPLWARVSSFTKFLDHTQRRTTVGRTPLDGWSDRRRDLYLTTHNTHNKYPCP